VQYKRYNLQKSRVKNVVKLYAGMLLNNEIDWIKLKNVYSRQIKDEFAEINVRKIIRQRKAQLMLTDALMEITEKHGISAKEALNKRKEVLDGAIADKNWSAANTSLTSFDEKLDLVPKKEKFIRKETISLKGFIPAGILTPGKPEVKQLKEKPGRSDYKHKKAKND